MSSAVIDEISNRSRAAIFAGLKQGYQDPHFTEVKLPDPVCHLKTSGDLLTDFKANAAANKFTLHETSSDELPSCINGILKDSGARSLMYPSCLPFAADQLEIESRRCFGQPVEELREEVFSAEASLVCCRAGVSSHGVVLVVSSPEQPRLLSLAMPTCIMLLDKSRIVTSLAKALSEVKAQYGDKLPANLLFIAGPSRTSDIELTTVFGVHGPQQVHLVLY